MVIQAMSMMRHRKHGYFLGRRKGVGGGSVAYCGLPKGVGSAGSAPCAFWSLAQLAKGRPPTAFPRAAFGVLADVGSVGPPGASSARPTTASVAYPTPPSASSALMNPCALEACAAAVRIARLSLLRIATQWDR